MSRIGTVDSLWRYPVKSMAGEECDEVFVGFPGVYGDRVFAFRSSAAPGGFPYLTSREQRKLLQYRPRFRHPDRTARPVNLAEAQNIPPGATPLYAEAEDWVVDVTTPTGETFAIDDPALLKAVREGVSGEPELTLIRSERALTDCRPVSLFSLQTVKQLGEEVGGAIDKRAFRANVYLDLNAPGFAENDWVGRSVRLGDRVVVSVVERDPRCVMITLDPETSEARPEILKQVAQAHNGNAGLYAVVLAEGMLRKGDPVELLD